MLIYDPVSNFLRKDCNKVTRFVFIYYARRKGKEMRNSIDIHAAREAASENERFAEIKIKMLTRLYRVSRARALEILAERVVEKAEVEAEKEAREAAHEAKRIASQKALMRRIAEHKKLRG